MCTSPSIHHPDRRRCCGTGTAGPCALRRRTGPAWSSPTSSCCAAAMRPCRTRRRPPWRTTERRRAQRDSGRRPRSWGTCTCLPAAACSCGRRYVSYQPVSGLLSGLCPAVCCSSGKPAVCRVVRCVAHPQSPPVTLAPCASQQDHGLMCREVEPSRATTYTSSVLGVVWSKQVGRTWLARCKSVCLRPAGTASGILAVGPAAAGRCQAAARRVPSARRHHGRYELLVPYLHCITLAGGCVRICFWGCKQVLCATISGCKHRHFHVWPPTRLCACWGNTFGQGWLRRLACTSR